MPGRASRLYTPLMPLLFSFLFFALVELIERLTMRKLFFLLSNGSRLI